MADIIRDSTLGQLIRFVTGNKLLLYPEEVPGFQCPSSYGESVSEKQPEPPNNQQASEHVERSETTEKQTEAGADIDSSDSSSTPELRPVISHATTFRDEGHNPISRIGSLPGWDGIETQADLERAYTNPSLARGESRPVIPTRTADGTILVDWYTTDDPENPQNWSSAKKGFVVLQICLYTFAVYIGSAIYAASIPGVIQRFGVSETAASLGLALYVLAYGIGPMLFAPMSEIPVIGRNPPYVVTFALFTILCVPTAVVQNFAGLLVLRFLLGFFGSPCLATGAATFQDMYNIMKIPYLLTFWAAAATCGPALGPVISGFSVAAEGWRWSSWELLWIAGPVWVLLFIALPETSADNILYRRAHRLRRVTGNANLKSQSEIDQSNFTVSQVAFEALIKPWEINAFDPAVLFTTIYTALVYGIYYSFFESFPLVYIGIYDFNLGESGLPFLSVLAAISVAIPAYCAWWYLAVERPIAHKPLGPPEERLTPGLWACFLVPIGLFVFGWTSRRSVHWIVSIIGVGINILGTFTIIQSIFLYLPFTYPKYAASLFAANDFARSGLAFASILFSRPMFDNIGVPAGISLLAGCTIACIVGLYALYIFGGDLRKRSKFAAK